MFGDFKWVAAAIEESAGRLGVVGVERLEAGGVTSRHFVRVLDLDCVEGVRTVNDEVDFNACLRAPEKELVLAAAIVVPGGEMLEDKPFETGTVDFARAVERTLRAQDAENTRVKEIVFVVSHEITLGALGEDGKMTGDQHILQNFEVTVNCRASHSCLARDVAS